MGEIIAAANNAGQVFAIIQVTRISEVLFKNIPLRRLGHERYRSKSELNDTFSRYYGRRPSPNEIVTVLEFELVERASSRKAASAAAAAHPY